MGFDMTKTYALVKMQVLERMVKAMTPRDPLTVVMMVAEVMLSNVAKMQAHVKMQVLDRLVML